VRRRDLVVAGEALTRPSLSLVQRSAW